MNYIHCYSCYVQPKQETEHLFHISSCGKLYCSAKCLQKGNLSKCQTCSKCEVILLTDAPPEVQEFFSDVGTVLEEMQRKCQRILTYQNGLKDRMFKCVYKKYSNLKSEYVKLNQQYTTLLKDYKRLQEHVKRDAASRQSSGVNMNNPSNHQMYFGNQPGSGVASASSSSFSLSSKPLLMRSNNNQSKNNVTSSNLSRNADHLLQHRAHQNSFRLNETSSITSTPSLNLLNSGAGSTLVNSNGSEPFLTLSKLSLQKYKRL